MVIAAGGTGGHFFPAEALAAELLRRGERVVLMTDARSGGLNSTVFAQCERFVLRGAGIAGRGLVKAMRAGVALGLGTWQARRMLARLQGRHHQVVTGVCLMHLRSHRERIFAVSTDVLFHPLTARQIRNYLARIQPLDKAGAYAIQDAGELIISEISGSYSNVVGLPVEKLREELATWGGD